jgi:F-type H+-transporting ATPase subunit epsilon|tara:strand:- start:24 stop:407 length:384 start_codon:yes stop_codon:yes gene_type:complete
MSLNFNLEIISPDKKIFVGETSEIIIPGFEGYMTVLKEHIPFITFLRPGIIDGKNLPDQIFVEEGTVEFSKNKLLILSSTAIFLKELQKDKRDSLRQEAEKLLSGNNISDKQRYILSYKVDTLKQIN